MKKLTVISEFLISLNLFALENFDSWVDNPRIVPSGKKEGNDSILLYRIDYTASISIERYAHKQHSAELLFGHVCAWLMQNDADDNEIATPSIDVDILDDATADIEINIDMQEDVMGVEDPAGDIHLNGKTYRIDDAVIDYAEEGEVDSHAS